MATNTTALDQLVANANAEAEQARKKQTLSIEAFLNGPVVSLPTLPSGISKAEAGAYNQARQESLNAADYITKQQSVFNAAVEQQKGAIDRVAQAQADEEKEKQQREQRIADQNLAVNEMFGISTDPLSRAAQLNTRAMEQYETAQNKLAAADRAANATIISDPLLWLTKSMIVPELSSEAATADTQWQGTKAEIDRMNSESAAQQELLAKNIPSITVGMAKAKTDVAFANASLDKSVVDRQAAEMNVDMAQKAHQDRIQAITQTINLEQSKRQQLNASIESSARAAAFAANQQEQRIRFMSTLAELKDQEAKEMYSNAVAYRGMQMLGYTPKNMGEVKVIMQSWPQAKKDQVMTAGFSQTLGPNVGEAVITLAQFKGGGQGMAAETKATRDLISTIIGRNQKLQETISAGAKNPAAAVAAAQAATPELTRNIASWFNNPSDRKETKVLDPKALMVLSAAKPETAKMFNGVSKDTFTIINSLAKQNTTVGDELAAKSIISGLASKGYNSNQIGKQLSAYYTGLVNIRNSMHDFKTFGLLSDQKVMDAVKSYKIDSGAFGFGSGTIDLTKPEQANKYVIMNLANKLNFSAGFGVAAGAAGLNQ